MTTTRSRINLHVLMNGIQFASRVHKETRSLVESGLFDHICIAGLQEDDLPEHETVDAQRTIWRARLRTRPWPRSLPFQLVKYLEFCVRMIRYARRIRPAVVNVHTLDILPLGVLLKWTCGARLVFDAHELETETNGLTGIRQRLARIVERLLIHRADMLIVVGGGIEDWYRARYGLTRTVTVMNCPRFRPLVRTRRIQETLGLAPDRKVLLYQGGLVPGRGIEGMIAAFAQQPPPGYTLAFMGYGSLEGFITRHAASHQDVHLVPAVDPGVVLEYTASASVGVAYIDNESLNDRLCLPNKFFEYIMAGVPVIVNDAPEMRRVVEQYDIGVVLQTLSAETLNAAIATIAGRDARQLEANLGRAAADLCWENQAAVMIEAYRKFGCAPAAGGVA